MLPFTLFLAIMAYPKLKNHRNLHPTDLLRPPILSRLSNRVSKKKQSNRLLADFYDYRLRKTQLIQPIHTIHDLYQIDLDGFA